MVQRFEIVNLLETFEQMEKGPLKNKLAYLIRGAVNEFLGIQPSSRKRVVLGVEAIAYLRDGRKIMAVKAEKERLGLSLMDAKQHVEENMVPYYVPQTNESF